MQVWTSGRRLLPNTGNGIENSRQVSHSFQQELMSPKGNENPPLWDWELQGSRHSASP